MRRERRTDAPAERAAGERLARAGRILAAILRGTPSHPLQPDPEPATWGAQGACAAAADSGSVVVRIYVFNSYADARATEDSLVDEAGVTSVNGALLLYATAAPTDAVGQDKLIDIRSAFAGDE